VTIELQPSLFDLAAPALGRLSPRRTQLAHGAWVDHQPSWVTGSDQLFLDLVETVPWRAERRQMYDRVVDVPRLLSFYDEADPLPHPVLREARQWLSDHYRDELGEAFTTAGLCYYRDGRDSVAWHGDRIGRSRTEDTMVAIVSIGEPRKLLLRPHGGPSVSEEVEVRAERASKPQTLSFALGHGDLLVMGGSCQRTWEHAVPKTAKPVGPRISIQYRPHGVR